LAWTFEFTKATEKQLTRLGRAERQRIVDFLFERVAFLENPRSIGEAMKGKKYKGLWKYRSGDYRIICEIRDERISIVVVKLGHRREVYQH